MPRRLRRKRVEYLSKLFEDRNKLSPEAQTRLNKIMDWSDENQNNKRTKGQMSKMIQDAQILGEAKDATKEKQ